MTAWTEMVGIERPLQQAAMSRVATPELVAAVSNVGGLGMVPMGRSGLDAALGLFDQLDGLTDKPYGAGFVMPFFDEEVHEAIVARLEILEFAFGWPDAALASSDNIVGWLVGTVDEAKAAADAGCAYVIAQGTEAGGHVRNTVPFDELLPAVVAAVDIPVVATGGIGTRDDADRAFELGADGIRIGTRFLGAAETNIHPRYLELMVEAGADDTTWTLDYQVGWPGPPEATRILTASLEAAHATELDPVGKLGDRDIERFATTPPIRETTGFIDPMALYAGRSVGALNEVSSAASIIDELLGER